MNKAESLIKKLSSSSGEEKMVNKSHGSYVSHDNSSDNED